VFSAQDYRHPPDEMTMAYLTDRMKAMRAELPKENQGDEGTNLDVAEWENRGVLHLVHAWAGQGWPAAVSSFLGDDVWEKLIHG